MSSPHTLKSTDKSRWILGNWKLNGSTDFVQQYGQQFCAALEGAQERLQQTAVGLFPPAVYLSALQQQLTLGKSMTVAIGAQNCSDQSSGAFTGELSAEMLSDVSCPLCLVGHSERRQLFAETDETVTQKVSAVLAAGGLPVLCVGETLSEREADQTLTVIERQLKTVLTSLAASQIGAQLLIAYEPVWAIGTGLTATPEQAQTVHAFIREFCKQYISQGAKVPLLYGGSVKPDNAAELLSQQDIDGLLVGGASLKPETFAEIVLAGV